MADVEDYFPDAPELCMDCPALQAAANSLEFSFGLAAASSESVLNPSEEIVEGLNSVETTRRREAVARWTTEEALRRQDAVRAVAAELTGKCVAGALSEDPVKPSDKRGFLINEHLRICRSNSATAAFVPTVYQRTEFRKP
jgi:hypothetical protein